MTLKEASSRSILIERSALLKAELSKVHIKASEKPATARAVLIDSAVVGELIPGVFAFSGPAMSFTTILALTPRSPLITFEFETHLQGMIRTCFSCCSFSSSCCFKGTPAPTLSICPTSDCASPERSVDHPTPHPKRNHASCMAFPRSASSLMAFTTIEQPLLIHLQYI